MVLWRRRSAKTCPCLLRSMLAENYRSLRSIRMDLTGVNLFIGENGVGKSNLYRALQLVQSAVRGKLAYEIAKEGGMSSADDEEV
ncbi:hypothetical protein USDA257_c55670 [Sinorhizobium fredii USDA 257]|uniref:Endonuclease GajA/Old nuclease/RecF-like AAA domain-containing protein n=1 Tax=Sinorhizobium fredii (strain USDA 257) TaxID=1185652 RepID=I3XDX6_SINF2|nr:hypothetical protein USDA257_c55670 [Sinorhizobium fredii USDA 257]